MSLFPEKALIPAMISHCRRKKYEIVDRSWVSVDGESSMSLVARDGGCLVFLEVALVEDFEEEKSTLKYARQDFEMAAARWLAEHPEVYDCGIRFDTLEGMPISGDRIVIRHHIDAMSTQD